MALELTDRGTELVDEILAARANVLAPMVAALSTAERADLERLLGRVAGRLADDRRTATHVCRLCDRDLCMSGPGCPLEHTMTLGARRPRTRDSASS